MKINPILPLLLFIGLILENSALFAFDTTYTANRHRIAIKGYDPVGYFIQNTALKGDKYISVEYDGAKWLFSSEANRQIFLGNPTKYMPQYGGYCAYALSRNAVSSSKPEYFTILNGKLYLKFGKVAFKRWSKDPEKYIALADASWAKRVNTL